MRIQNGQPNPKPPGPQQSKANTFASKLEASKTTGLSKVQVTQVQNPVDYNSSSTQIVDPSKHGPIAQLINERFKLAKNQNKRYLSGRKLQELLQKEYGRAEFKRLPRSLKNLIRFDRNISSAEILKFVEYMNNEHEISFKDFEYDQAKFRAVFEAMGELQDIEMQVSPNTFVALADNFPLKAKIMEIFDIFRRRLSLRRRQVSRKSQN